MPRPKRPTTRLTEEQAALVEENFGLTIYAIKKHNDLNADFSELLGISLEALCEAAQTYEPAHGCKFSPYAVQAILWRLGHEKIKRIRRARRTVWLDAPKPNTDDEWDIEDTYASTMTTDDGWVEQAEKRIDEERFEVKLTEKERNVLKLLKQGRTLSEVGDLLGVTHENVRTIRNKIREKHRKAGL